MSKRFTDTEIWDKQWFMELSLKHKCLIRFIFDKCDVAGIWEANWVLASTYIGEDITEKDIIPISSQIQHLRENKYFVPDFIEFQYGELSASCKPHIKVIQILKKYNLFDKLNKGYTKGMQPLEEKEKDKEEDKEVMQGRFYKMIPDKFKDNLEFWEAWKNWFDLNEKRFTEIIPQQAKKQFEYLSKHPDPIKLLEQAFINNWKGLMYDIKNKSSGTEPETASQSELEKYAHEKKLTKPEIKNLFEKYEYKDGKYRLKNSSIS